MAIKKIYSKFSRCYPPNHKLYFIHFLGMDVPCHYLGKLSRSFEVTSIISSFGFALSPLCSVDL